VSIAELSRTTDRTTPLENKDQRFYIAPRGVDRLEKTDGMYVRVEENLNASEQCPRAMAREKGTDATTGVWP